MDEQRPGETRQLVFPATPRHNPSCAWRQNSGSISQLLRQLMAAKHTGVQQIQQRDNGINDRTHRARSLGDLSGYSCKAPFTCAIRNSPGDCPIGSPRRPRQSHGSGMRYMVGDTLRFAQKCIAAGTGGKLLRQPWCKWHERGKSADNLFAASEHLVPERFHSFREMRRTLRSISLQPQDA